MANSQLDSLDYKILEMLSANARKPYLEIARECNVSGAAIHQRIQKLYSIGVITGSESLIDPSTVGYDTCAYIGLFLKDPSQFDQVIERLKKIPEVVECHITTGQYDMFIKIYAKNNRHLMSIIHGKLQNLGLARTESLISFKEVFKRQIPITPEEEEYQLGLTRANYFPTVSQWLKKRGKSRWNSSAAATLTSGQNTTKATSLPTPTNVRNN